jgi:MarR family transcriptional regulator for hemolysin
MSNPASSTIASMGPPDKPPIGLVVSRAAKTLSRAFEEALAGAGGSQPVWSILLALRTQPQRTQRQLAQILDIRETTLTHHLNRMERDGLITRHRDPANRRVHQVEMTTAGEAAFRRLHTAAVAFDQRLRANIPVARLDELTEILGLLVNNTRE